MMFDVNLYSNEVYIDLVFVLQYCLFKSSFKYNSYTQHLCASKLQYFFLLRTKSLEILFFLILSLV